VRRARPRRVLQRLRVLRVEDSPVHPDRFTQIFTRIVARAPVPRLRLHDLRHTHATLLLKAGVPIKVVSERLGHATPGFTMATYQHVLPGMQAEAARTFAAVIASTGFNPVEDPVEVAEAPRSLVPRTPGKPPRLKTLPGTRAPSTSRRWSGQPKRGAQKRLTQRRTSWTSRRLRRPPRRRIAGGGPKRTSQPVGRALDHRSVVRPAKLC
jgi:hypothetical protein